MDRPFWLFPLVGTTHNQLIIRSFDTFDRKGGKHQQQSDKKGKGDKKHEAEAAASSAVNTASVMPEGFRMADNLTKKDRQKLEKIIAGIEYAEAHGDEAEAEKLRQHLNDVNEQARVKVAHKAERAAERVAKGQAHDSTKVVHSGGRSSKVVQAS